MIITRLAWRSHRRGLLSSIILQAAAIDAGGNSAGIKTSRKLGQKRDEQTQANQHRQIRRAEDRNVQLRVNRAVRLIVRRGNQPPAGRRTLLFPAASNPLQSTAGRLSGSGPLHLVQRNSTRAARIGRLGSARTTAGLTVAAFAAVAWQAGEARRCVVHCARAPRAG